MTPSKKKANRRITLVGERVYLRPFRREDLSYVMKWSRDPELRKLVGEVSPMSSAQAERWYRGAHADKDRIWFAVVLKDGDRVIGESGLTDMTVIIGEKDAWRQGYGTEVGHLLLDYAFKRLKFHRVSIGVVGFNERAVRYWKSLGFKKEGAQRDGYYSDGRFSDFIMMSILEDEVRDRS
jgi:RimJ/RimL family protein N-acetyltransferase